MPSGVVTGDGNRDSDQEGENYEGKDQGKTIFQSAYDVLGASFI